MAFREVISTYNGSFVMLFDINSSGTTNAIRVENNLLNLETGLPVSVRVDVTSPRGKAADREFPPGVTSLNVPQNRRFRFENPTDPEDPLIDYSFSVTPLWEG